MESSKTRYVSFLRGINVGGNKILKMEVLKRYFEQMGFKDVLTYIQSGNILFRTKEQNIKKVNDQIEKKLAEHLGYQVEVFTRYFKDLPKILNNVPFKNIVPDKINKIYVAFLSSEPAEQNRIHFENLSYEAEKFIVSGTETYILLKKDKIKPKALFTNNFLEKKLGVSATTRDWNTIMKVVDL